jgi:N-acetylmuramoyl-L-alanine amidase
LENRRLPEQGSWHAFTPEQIAATVKLLRSLRNAYPEVRDVIAHEEMDPMRRRDPGPAFPLAAVRLETFGREGFLPPN